MAQHTLIFHEDESGREEYSLSGENMQVYKHIGSFLQEKRASGFLEASIDSVMPGNDSTIVFWHKGPAYRIDAEISLDIRDSTHTDSLQVLSFSEVESHVNQTLINYRNSGYPFASAQSQVLDYDSTHIHLQVDIQSGDRVRIDTIIIEQDNAPVSVSFLMAFLNIHQGDIFSEAMINQIPEKIDKLEFLELLHGPALTFNENLVSINMKLKSSASNSFDGIIGFTTQNNDKLELTGKVLIDLQNTLKQGERLLFDWSSPGNKSQSLDINTTVPYLAQTPFGLDLRFGLYKQDTSFLNLSFRAGLQYRFTFDHFVETFFRRQTSNVLNTVILNTKNLGFNSNSFGVAYQYKKLDSPILPHKGWLFRAEFTGGRKLIQQESGYPENFYDTIKLSTNTAEAFLLAEYYLNPLPRTVFVFRNETRYLQDKELTNNQLYRLGGIKNLKGFDEDEFSVSAYSMLHLEYRFLLERRSFLSVFWNGALTQQASADINYPYGLGTGVAFQTNSGIFNLYYALGKSQNESLQFRNSKIHFGFISRF